MLASLLASTLMLAPLAGSAAAPLQEPAAPVTEAAAEPVSEVQEPFPVARGEDLLELLVPRGELLTYEARLSLGMIDASVGTVTLESRVETYRASLLGGGGGASGETASIVARAVGGYTVYQLDSSLETRFQPTAWPAMIHRMTQAGTEKRRRETLVGEQDGVFHGTYRSDTRTGAPIGTRIWREPAPFVTPRGVVDSLGGVFLVRTMLRDGIDELVVPVLDKQRVWDVTIRLSDALDVETPAGNFRARPVVLATTKRSDGDGTTDDSRNDGEQFSGPFGIKGDIRLYVEESTGVPIVISGTLPAGPLEIELDIRLTAHSGTPAGFGQPPAEPVEAALDTEPESEPGSGTAEARGAGVPAERDAEPADA